MALGYEKINTSAARSKRRGGSGPATPRPSVTPAGVVFNHRSFGRGVTAEAFVSQSDVVLCEFAKGFEVAVSAKLIEAGRVA